MFNRFLLLVLAVCAGCLSVAHASAEQKPLRALLITDSGHQCGKARVFGTTYGHSDEAWRDPVFLTHVSRGVLWATGRLEP